MLNPEVTLNFVASDSKHSIYQITFVLQAVVSSAFNYFLEKFWRFFFLSFGHNIFIHACAQRFHFKEWLKWVKFVHKLFLFNKMHQEDDVSGMGC